MDTQQAQASKASLISHSQSLTLMKNMLGISISTICYLRNLFSGRCFKDKRYAGMNIFQLQCAKLNQDGELMIVEEQGYRLTRWLEDGVFEALTMNYLRRLDFLIVEPVTGDRKDDKLIERYSWSFEYPVPGEVRFDDGKKMTQGGVKDQIVKLIRNLIEFSNTLEDLPGHRYLTLKLHYYEDITPPGWQPKHFRDEDPDTLSSFQQGHLRINLGQLATPHHNMKMRFEGADRELEREEAYIPTVGSGQDMDIGTTGTTGTTGAASKHAEASFSSQGSSQVSSLQLQQSRQSHQPLRQGQGPIGEGEDEKDEEEEDYIKVKDWILSKSQLAQGKGGGVQDKCRRALGIPRPRIIKAFEHLAARGIIGRKNSHTRWSLTRKGLQEHEKLQALEPQNQHQESQAPERNEEDGEENDSESAVEGSMTDDEETQLPPGVSLSQLTVTGKQQERRRSLTRRSQQMQPPQAVWPHQPGQSPDLAVERQLRGDFATPPIPSKAPPRCPPPIAAPSAATPKQGNMASKRVLAPDEDTDMSLPGASGYEVSLSQTSHGGDSARCSLAEKPIWQVPKRRKRVERHD
ncbi:unnamed protein product [Chrysoparadoxa australica]